MGPKFAIITFRDEGPIKTWSDLRGAEIHNSRLKPIEHGIEGAPPPKHLIGSGDLVSHVKGQLKRVGIDPDNLRKNGVIAYEAVMTASPAFFDAGTEAEREDRLEEWTKAQVRFAIGRWGAHRVASMVLHLDEKTPHIHLVVLPLDVKADKRRCDPQDMHWGLVGRMISGPGQFDQLQDDYAEAMAPLGLSRGVRGSGRKHMPMAVYLAQLAERESDIDRARSDIAIGQDDLDRQRGEMEAARISQRRVAGEQMAALQALEQRMVEERRRLDEDHVEAERVRKKRAYEDELEHRSLASLAAQVERDRQAVAEERQSVAASAASNREYRERLNDFCERMKPVLAAANDFIAKSNGIDPAELAPRALEARVAAVRTIEAATRPAPHPATNDGVSVAQQAAFMARQDVGR